MGTGNFRTYRSVADDGDYLGKITAFLEDRPGSLAFLASIFAGYGINITYFHYNRSEHPNRVLIEVRCDNESAISNVKSELSGKGLLVSDAPEQELSLVDTRNLLKMEVALEHRPGALGEFARVLADHGANVIHMAYNEELSENSANISIVTQDPNEVDNLLKDMNWRGYHYSIIYRGMGQKEVDDVIGLNLVERFFFRLKVLLGTEDVERVKELVDSSKSISSALLKFSNEAGKHLEEGSVYTSVLAFASASLSRTGQNFTYTHLPQIQTGDVTFHAFRLPTGGNVFVLAGPGESVMVDGTYGIYYEDVKKMLRETGIEPSSVRRIFISHADADHAGTSGYFAEEFGSRVFIHPTAEGVIEHQDRSHGSGSSISQLNRYFTTLVNEFTRMRHPASWNAYGSREQRAVAGGFKVIDRFDISGQAYEVIESMGGHVPGQVFFFSPDSGLLFTGDYLLLVDSLSPEEKEFMNLPRFMMTSTNVDSPLFRREMGHLREFALSMDDGLRARGKSVTIVPGHGDYYPCDRLR